MRLIRRKRGLYHHDMGVSKPIRTRPEQAGAGAQEEGRQGKANMDLQKKKKGGKWQCKFMHCHHFTT